MKKSEISNAYNLGFIAKMNKQDRVPAHDQKFMNEFKDELTAFNFEAWLRGWDDANLEYEKYESHAK
jgi:hypothetical protein